MQSENLQRILKFPTKKDCETFCNIYRRLKRSKCKVKKSLKLLSFPTKERDCELCVISEKTLKNITLLVDNYIKRL